MVQSRFTRPRGVECETSSNLYVANCGPAVGLSFDKISAAFSIFGEVRGVYAADESGTRVIVSYSEASSAQSALKQLDGYRCPDLGGRILHIRYSMLLAPCKVDDSVPVCLAASELSVPGAYLMHDFISEKEEQELLAAVDERLWKNLAKRRVQHYGYEFMYETRNVDSKQFLGELPAFVSIVLEKILSFPNLDQAEDATMDQLTVNEYPPGVGLSPHIDTHSSFDGLIFSLSLAGPCIMEFRRYSQGTWLCPPETNIDMKGATSADHGSNFIRRALFLPPRSMLLLSGEARYAWHHYIPHHKVDVVGEQSIKRGPRRVSFTFRKVRKGSCCCKFEQCCDSQRGRNDFTATGNNLVEETS